MKIEKLKRCISVHKHWLYLLLPLYLLTACTGYSITETEVTRTLTDYGQAHPQTHFRITTSKGVIEGDLFQDTPLHRANFCRLVQMGFYTDKATFYRVKQSFMIQGGDQSRSEPSHLVPAEIKHPHVYGALAAARRDANPAQASNAADFYIVTGEGWDKPSLQALGITPQTPGYQQYLTQGGYPFLDGKYTVYGQVTRGMELVEH